MQRKKHGEHHESKSLWNYTLSPGWTLEEVKILKLALQKYGIGKWRNIVQSECLPDKSIGQIYIQTQRLLGQQSLGDFMGLHIDMQKVWHENSLKQGVMRKNGCVINTGDNPNKEERKNRIEENRTKYSISQEEVTITQNIRSKKSNCLDLRMIVWPNISQSKKQKISSLPPLKNSTIFVIQKPRSQKSLNISKKTIKLKSNQTKKQKLFDQFLCLLMEQFDSYNPVNVGQILDKIKLIGFLSTKQKFTIIDSVIDYTVQLIKQFVNSNQPSLITYLVQQSFSKSKSKSSTFEYCNSLLNSLELYNTKESATILYLVYLDECQDLCLFFLQVRNAIYNYTQEKQPLEDIQLKFNDLLQISASLFQNKSVDELIKMIKQELYMANSRRLDPLIQIDAASLLHILMRVKRIHQQPFETPKKSQKQQSKSPISAGFYKWGSPYFNKEEFLLNPQNQKMLSDVHKYAQQHPQMRKSTPVYNYISSLKRKKTDEDNSKDSTILELLRIKGINNNKMSTPKRFTESSFQVTSSFKKEDLIVQNQCLYSNQIPQNQTELINMVQMYNIEYFDPALSLPPPIHNQITYENIIDLYGEIESDLTFRKQIYQGTSYFSSLDPRYLKITQYGRIEALSQFEGWILAKNELGHIGCCSDTYLDRI